MNPFARKQAIAEALGWYHNANDAGPLTWFHPEHTSSVGTSFFGVPDYDSDLNAIHDAELELVPNLELEYQENLVRGLGLGDACTTWYDSIWYRDAAITAPAQVRAEALLRTLKMWED